MYFFRNPYSHNAPHDALFRIDVYQALVNPHLPAIPSSGSFSAGRFQHWNLQPFRWEWDRSVHFDAGFLGDDFQLVAHFLELSIVCARQTYARLPNHRPSFLAFFGPTDLLVFISRQLTANKNLSNPKDINTATMAKPCWNTRR